MQLSSTQSKAIKHDKGTMLVLAGPGSGKTTVITLRLKELVEHCNVYPGNILVITFTKAAASQMKSRFNALCPNCYGINFGTFHAVFFRILRDAYSFDTDNIISDKERNDIIAALVKKRSIESNDPRELVNDISREISFIRNTSIRPENYYPNSCGADDFRAICKGYDRELTLRNRLDFDDMLNMTYELLSEREDILEYWRDKFRYILIDEFQDINILQYRIIRLLAKPRNNLFVVGDDDQSIYHFRGSDPKIMLNFPKDYPDCKTVLLDANYRCPAQIVEASTRLIACNKLRFKKSLVSAAGSEGELKVLHFKNLTEQNSFVTQTCLELIKSGHRPSEIAILFRNNSQARPLLRIMNAYGIPFTVSDSIPDIYDHFIGRTILSYLAAADGDLSRSVFLEIINRPNRKIPREAFMKDPVRIKDIRFLLRDSAGLLDRFDRLLEDLAFMGRLDPYASIEFLRKRLSYDDYLKDYARLRGLDADELLQILGELQEDSKGHRTYADWCEHIKEVRETMATVRTVANTDAVRFLTFHSAKGLEFDNVFIIDAIDGLTPGRRADVMESIEEERRMFYVAMTRARKRLFILTESERLGRKAEPSRFIAEL